MEHKEPEHEQLWNLPSIDVIMGVSMPKGLINHYKNK